MSDLRELVAEKRRRLGWSIRTAATKGGISNTKWGEWENGNGDLGVMQPAVALAFDWPDDWPTNPPTLPDPELTQLRAEMEELRTRLEAVEDRHRARTGDTRPPPKRAAG